MAEYRPRGAETSPAASMKTRQEYRSCALPGRPDLGHPPQTPPPTQVESSEIGTRPAELLNRKSSSKLGH